MRKNLALVALAACAACAHDKQSWSEVSAPEAYLDVLPTVATVEVDGAVKGQGPMSVAVPDKAGRLKVKISADGFAPVELDLSGEQAAGAHVGVVLPPTGFGAARGLQWDDVKGLTVAAQVLLKADKAALAVEYLVHAVNVDKNHAPAHRTLGKAYLKLGKQKEAMGQYEEYLSLTPDAPDAKAIRDALAKAKGDLTIPVGQQK